MATKKTSGKTAASTRAPRKKQDASAAKAPKAAQAAVVPAAARPSKAAKSKPVEKASTPRQAASTANAAKPAKATKPTKTVTALPQEAPPAKSAGSEPIAAQIGATSPQPVSPSRTEIAARAAAIWRETGGAPFDNWIRAERELGA